MNKILLLIILMISFQGFYLQKALPMEAESSSKQAELEKCAAQFISFLNSNSGRAILDIFSDRELKNDLAEKILHATNELETALQAKLIFNAYDFLNVLYHDNQLILKERIISELKIAFIDSLKIQCKEHPGIASELIETFNKIENKTEEPSFKQILLIFSDLIGYEDVREAIALEVTVRELLSDQETDSFEESEEWRQKKRCVIL